MGISGIALGELILTGVLLHAGTALSGSLSAAETIHVNVHLNVRRSTGGVSEFDRRKFINMHSSQTESEWDSPEMRDQFLNGWDVYLGREVGATLWNYNQMREDSARPGFLDVVHIAELGAQRRHWYHDNAALHPFEAQRSHHLDAHSSVLPRWHADGRLRSAPPTRPSWCALRAGRFRGPKRAACCPDLPMTGSRPEHCRPNRRHIF